MNDKQNVNKGRIGRTSDEKHDLLFTRTTSKYEPHKTKIS